MEYFNTAYEFTKFSFCYCMPCNCQVHCLQIQTYCSKANERISVKSNAMKQISSCEGSTPQEIPQILWNPKVHCHAHKIPHSSTLLSQMNSVHILTCYYFKIHFNIILFRFSSPKWPLPFISVFIQLRLMTPSPYIHICVVHRTSWTMWYCKDSRTITEPHPVYWHYLFKKAHKRGKWVISKIYPYGVIPDGTTEHQIKTTISNESLNCIPYCMNE